MNKKKYVSVGVFIVVIAIGAGVTYYFYPASINGILGIDSAEVDTAPGIDISTTDNASSSLPAFDAPTDDNVAAVPAAPAKKSAQKKTSIAVPAAPPEQTDESQAQISAPSILQDTNSATADGTSSSPLPSSSPSAISVAVVPCSFPASAPSTTRQLILNEIAWMGSPSSSNAEWMELKNNSASDADLSGWELMNASGKLKIVFSANDTIAAGGLLLLSRGTTVAGAAKIYSGDLTNAGDVLALFDPQCSVSDYLDASHGWPAGNNTTKATLERDANGVGWHTSAMPGGTPGAENSAGPPPAQYKLTVAFEGEAASATIASDPVGLVCGASCAGSFSSGTQITLTPAAGQNTAFSGWSGLCYGQTKCSFTIGTNTSLVASFRSTLAAPTGGSSGGSDSNNASGSSATTSVDASADVDIPSLSTGVTTTIATSSPPADSGNSDANSGTAAAASHVLIAAVQITGASAANDLVKLYNPTATTIDMSGWKLHKKSQTGTDYSVKVFPAGSTILAGQSFTWANSAGGFSDSIGANVSSTETLSADNSVALMDAAGNIVDAVAWGTGTGQYGEGPPYPTSPGANQLLSRRSSDGVLVDTDNNTNDFTLQ